VSATIAAAATVATSPGEKDNGPMRIVIFILVFAVIASLFSGLYFVYKDKGGSNRVVVSLTIRIALSLTIFALLIAAYVFGWIPERGL
jgi:hypothetical protein